MGIKMTTVKSSVSVFAFASQKRFLAGVNSGARKKLKLSSSPVIPPLSVSEVPAIEEFDISDALVLSQSASLPPVCVPDVEFLPRNVQSIPFFDDDFSHDSPHAASAQNGRISSQQLRFGGSGASRPFGALSSQTPRFGGSTNPSPFGASLSQTPIFGGSGVCSAFGATPALSSSQTVVPDACSPNVSEVRATVMRETDKRFFFVARAQQQHADFQRAMFENQNLFMRTLGRHLQK